MASASSAVRLFMVIELYVPVIGQCYENMPPPTARRSFSESSLVTLAKQGFFYPGFLLHPHPISLALLAKPGRGARSVYWIGLCGI